MSHKNLCIFIFYSHLHFYVHIAIINARALERYLREFVSINADVLEFTSGDFLRCRCSQSGDDQKCKHNEEFHFGRFVDFVCYQRKWKTV